MHPADIVGPLLTPAQWVILLFFGAAIAVTLMEHRVFPTLRRAMSALRASRDATSHPAPKLNSQPRIRVSPRAEWKLTEPHPGLQAYKQKKAKGLL